MCPKCREDVGVAVIGMVVVVVFLTLAFVVGRATACPPPPCPCYDQDHDGCYDVPNGGGPTPSGDEGTKETPPADTDDSNTDTTVTTGEEIC